MKKALVVIIMFLISTIIYAQESNSITQDQVDAIVKSVEQSRQLPFKTKVKYEVLSRDEMLQHIKEAIKKQYSGEQLLYEEAVLKLFKLVDKDFDYEKLLNDLYKEQAGGMYDDTRKSLYIADWIPAELQQPVLFHELIHALSDQYHPMQKYLAVGLTSDKKLARAAVVEGEGTYFMLLNVLESFGMSLDSVKGMIDLDKLAEFQDFGAIPGMDVAATAPKFIQGQVLFPYLKGLGFLNKFLKEKTVKDISELYENPPSSTEQILHIEKYRKDEPVDVTLHFDEEKLQNWKQVHSDDIGEYNLLLILKERLNVENSKIASEGWAGDKYVLLKQLNNFAIVYKSVWDTKGDALEFYTNFITWFGGKKNIVHEGTWMEDGDLHCLIARKDSSVIIVLGAIEQDFAKKLL
ncbi:MAG: hypothetical protein A2Y62_10765 [Candidatus Fischerbacteria bacterium RBG_13_37_8]|uniref:Uncharacterized protein n=1 Tax=Candidatus Fischerbacteria bacterium RBG_13_37_8 TaxID=1817863 RepID=A0A1F5VVD3_9BACT|nr:MAG: hypothetical protein A2Y62_10765 [Candidatus Fischerbacteria bacterium RBG_13_37_8]